MSYSHLNSSTATKTKLRTSENFCPFSGMCVTCLDGCPGYCEIGRSAIRGREYIYPQPYGKVTAGGEKDYPLDFSHFNILGGVIGAEGIEANSDVATFPNVNIETTITNHNGQIQLKVPFFTTGLGSTDIARDNWKGVAIGCAISGTMVGIGENVCGVDPNSEIKNGRIVKSPEMERRIKLFQNWQTDHQGAIIVQENVEDSRLGTLEYVVEKLGVEFVELKWGQGAKDIGGEIKLSTLERAKELKKRGYIVYPDPEDPTVEEEYRKGGIKEFERHSRLGMVDKKDFIQRVETLRNHGAKYISLKTGAYRPLDLARALSYASEAKLDLLIIDGAGGGTGMSPWRMMNEWGIPTVYLECLTHQYCEILAKKGKHLPVIAMAGGFCSEDLIFKGLALGAPYVKLIAMGRAPIAAAMVGKTVGNLIQEGKVPSEYKEFGNSIEQIFIASAELKKRFGKEFEKIPPEAIGLYTYFDRLATGLKQFMAGARKFKLQYLDRNQLVALTKEAADLSGISYIMDADQIEAEKLLV